MVTISIFWSYSLHFFCLHLTQFILSTNYVCKQITNHGRQFPEAKIIKLGLEHYDYVTSCGNNNVWHNDNDHACLPSRVLNMEGVDLLLALFIRLWFFSNIYYDFLYFLILLGAWVNMTKKRMDDRMRVRFPVTPKSSTSCTHSYWPHFVSYRTLTCLLNKKYYFFCYKKQYKVVSLKLCYPLQQS